MPTRPPDPDRSTRPRIGIDLGGTKIEIVALSPDGHELLRHRTPAPQGSYEATLSAIATLVFDAEASIGVARGSSSVGVGSPGSHSRATGLLRNSNSTWLNGRPLRADLVTRLERPVAVANDANCFALSEATDGAASAADVVFGVILGTGVGGGLVVSGRLLEGANGIAGEWGHNPLPWPADDERPGPACYCAKHGCIETFLSGPGLARDHRSVTGEHLQPEEVASRAAAGDPAGDASLARYETRLARALAHVINLVDPDVIVLGGGLSNLDRLYRRVPVLWGEFAFTDRVDTRLVRHLHGDASGVRGAAWLGANGGDGK